MDFLRNRIFIMFMRQLINIKKLPQKILIIKPSSLGDVVHSLPFLNVMRDLSPVLKSTG